MPRQNAACFGVSGKVRLHATAASFPRARAEEIQNAHVRQYNSAKRAANVEVRPDGHAVKVKSPKKDD